MLLLDRCVELTGYGRKYVITLLHHLPESSNRILRPRQPIYGSAVQDALFVAWRTTGVGDVLSWCWSRDRGHSFWRSLIS